MSHPPIMQTFMPLCQFPNKCPKCSFMEVALHDFEEQLIKFNLPSSYKICIVRWNIMMSEIENCLRVNQKEFSSTKPHGAGASISN